MASTNRAIPCPENLAVMNLAIWSFANRSISRELDSSVKPESSESSEMDGVEAFQFKCAIFFMRDSASLPCNSANGHKSTE